MLVHVRSDLFRNVAFWWHLIQVAFGRFYKVCMMDSFANSDDTLLEGDLGDDVDYDLGNEDEDALLADDYDVQVSVTTAVI